MKRQKTITKNQLLKIQEKQIKAQKETKKRLKLFSKSLTLETLDKCVSFLKKEKEDSEDRDFNNMKQFYSRQLEYYEHQKREALKKIKQKPNLFTAEQPRTQWTKIQDFSQPQANLFDQKQLAIVPFSNWSNIIPREDDKNMVENLCAIDERIYNYKGPQFYKQFKLNHDKIHIKPTFHNKEFLQDYIPDEMKIKKDLEYQRQQVFLQMKKNDGTLKVQIPKQSINEYHIITGEKFEKFLKQHHLYSEFEDLNEIQNKQNIQKDLPHFDYVELFEEMINMREEREEVQSLLPDYNEIQAILRKKLKQDYQYFMKVQSGEIMSPDGEVQYLKLLKRKNNRVVSDTNSPKSVINYKEIKIKKVVPKQSKQPQQIKKQISIQEPQQQLTVLEKLFNQNVLEMQQQNIQKEKQSKIDKKIQEQKQKEKMRLLEIKKKKDELKQQQEESLQRKGLLPFQKSTYSSKPDPSIKIQQYISPVSRMQRSQLFSSKLIKYKDRNLISSIDSTNIYKMSGKVSKSNLLSRSRQNECLSGDLRDSIFKMNDIANSYDFSVQSPVTPQARNGRNLVYVNNQNDSKFDDNPMSSQMSNSLNRNSLSILI